MERRVVFEFAVDVAAAFWELREGVVMIAMIKMVEVIPMAMQYEDEDKVGELEEGECESAWVLRMRMSS